MSVENTILIAFLGLVGSAILSWALTKWRNAKGKTSGFASDTSLEDIGLSALSSMFDSFSPSRLDGITELRPTWGMRLIMPVIAVLVLVYFDFGPLFDSLGLTDPTHQSWVLIGIGLLVAKTWFTLMFVQRIEYGEGHIKTYGIDRHNSQRDLSDLVDIKVHEKRPALMLTFADQPPLYVPKFISKRAQFLSDMEAVVSQNRGRGLSVPEPTLSQKMGFS